VLKAAVQSSAAERIQAYRRRIRAAGSEEVLFQLPRETVAMLDEIKQSRGLRNRSQALLQLIEQGRQAAQQSV
jgi:hypothetical protein